MNKRKVSKNLIITFCSYAFLLVLNIWVSKLVLISYGSEVNGLLSSVNQIYTYVALLEAGIGTATIVALYEPLAKKDHEKVSQICSASVAYYREILRWYIACVVILSFVWPLALNTNIDYWTVWGVVFIQGVSNALTFYFVSTIINYLLANGENYINVFVHTAITILTYLLKAWISLCSGNVLLISAAMLGINVVKVLFYWIYKRVKCRHICFTIKAEKKLLKQRSSFLVHEAVGCVFSSTDLILISVFCDLKIASVYAVYSMVTSALSSIIGQIFNSTKYVLGDAYQKKGYCEVHDKFNKVYITIVFCMYTITYTLFSSFIKVYTKNINDINYSLKYLPILFVVIQLLSSCRNVDTVLIKNAMHSRQTINRAIIEAMINLGVSVLLVNFIGIYGVLLGTVCALLYRSNDMIIYANKKILGRSPWCEYKLHLFNFLIFAAFLIINEVFPIEATNYIQLILKAIVVTVVVSIVYFVLNVFSWKKIENH